MFSLYFSLVSSHSYVRHFRPHVYEHKHHEESQNMENFIYEDQLTDLGYSNKTQQDLITCIKKFGFERATTLPYFVAICSYASKNGTITIESDSTEKYRGSGFLMLKGSDQYLNFAQIMKDDKILSEGAEYVSKMYPWTSSAYMWKQNYMNDVVNPHNYRTVSIEKVCKEMFGETCQKDLILDLFNQSKTVFDQNYIHIDKNADILRYYDSYRNRRYM